MNKLTVGLLVATLGSGMLGCSPKIYLVDRQTVLEDEAAAEWPEFEKDLLNKTEAQGPTPFATTSSSDGRSTRKASSEEETRKARLYKVLNGELGSEPGKTAQ